MEGTALDDPALDLRDRMRDDKRVLVNRVHDGPDSADLEARDDAVENGLLHAAHAALPLVNRHGAIELVDDAYPDRIAPGRYDGDGRVFLEAVNDEVDGPRRL